MTNLSFDHLNTGFYTEREKERERERDRQTDRQTDTV